MKQGWATAIFAFIIGLGACSHPQLFSSDVMKDVDPNFDFSRWRTVPNQALERKIQLGGSILQVERQDGGVTIVARQLPIVEHPAYGPKDTGKTGGEFATIFQGPIDPQFLQRGNRMIAVTERDDGDVLGRESELDDALDGTAVVGEEQRVGHR